MMMEINKDKSQTISFNILKLPKYSVILSKNPIFQSIIISLPLSTFPRFMTSPVITVTKLLWFKFRTENITRWGTSNVIKSLVTDVTIFISYEMRGERQNRREKLPL